MKYFVQVLVIYILTLTLGNFSLSVSKTADSVQPIFINVINAIIIIY